MAGPDTSKLSALAPGYRLDRYELLFPIAEGGMASVWVARQPGKHGFEKLVAIKTILPQYANDARYKTMFLDEARLAAKIQHVNVTQILDLGDEKGVLYLAMEYVDGDSLASLGDACENAGGRMPLGILARVAVDTCSGLHAAHELATPAGQPLGIVHRDVSPQNILVSSDGTAKIIDFGVAKAQGRLASTTNAGLLKGKIHYMPPEQALERPIDRRTDLWAVGAVLYRFMTGTPPYEGANALGTLHLLASKRPLAPLPSTVPPALGAVVQRALAYEPGDRYATCAEMRDALERAMLEADVQTTHADVAAFTAKHLGPELEKRRQAIHVALEAAAGRRAPAEVPGSTAPAPSAALASLVELPAPPPPIELKTADFIRSVHEKPARPPPPIAPRTLEPIRPAPPKSAAPPLPASRAKPSPPVGPKPVELPKKASPDALPPEMGLDASNPVARCPTHDLVVAPDGKCALCRREEAAIAPPPARPQIGVGAMAAGVVVLAAAGVVVIVAGARPSAIAIPAPAAAASSSAPLAQVDRVPTSQPLAALEPAEVDANPTAVEAKGASPLTPLDLAIQRETIVLYSRPDDPQCDSLRRWLLAHGHNFKERDVDADREAMKKTGGSVPALEIDGVMLRGFDAERIQAAIEYAGVTRVQKGR